MSLLRLHGEHEVFVAVTMVILQLYIPTVISFAMLPMLEEDESEQHGWWKIAIVYVDAVINGFGISGMYLAAW